MLKSKNQSILQIQNRFTGLLSHNDVCVCVCSNIKSKKKREKSDSGVKLIENQHFYSAISTKIDFWFFVIFSFE